MPGYVIHLAAAETFLDICRTEKNVSLRREDGPWENREYINRFLLGSIVPDIRKGSQKKNTHFWSDEMMKHFQRKPDLRAFLDKYGEFLSEPFVFGYYAHLYLDYRFVNGYWRSHFAFFDGHMRETDDFELMRWVKCTRKPCGTDGFVARERFFSGEYYYGDYSRMNDYIMHSYNIRMPYLDFGGFHHSEGINIIEEIRGDDLLPALREMLTFLESAFSGMPQDRADGAAVQKSLKVFDLNAMRELIARTAQELYAFAESNGLFAE